MKIEVKERGSKAYYDEFLYIASRYEKIKKKPTSKAFRMTHYCYGYLLIVLLFILFSIKWYLDSSDMLFVYSIGAYSILLFFGLYYLIVCNKRIKTMMNSMGTKTIDINDKDVGYIDSDKEFKVKWEDISNVVINKYSICFIPKTINGAIISISTDYKKKVMEALKKYDKEKYVVDNTVKEK